MIDLLKTFSIQQIIIFIVLLALAIKGVVSFIDWLKNKNNEVAKKTQTSVQIIEDIEKHEQEIDEINSSIKDLTKKIDILIDSDKDAIKAYITKEHHYFCYERGWIDDYSLDCIEKRYEHYEAQGGNSFIEDLMKDLRDLPKQETN